jgi:polysaccharide export outer membrane protein
MKYHHTFAMLLAAVLGISGCVEQPDPVKVSIACRGDTCQTTGEYKIGPGDVLHVSVWKDENLNRTVTVRPDGMVSFPLLNDVQATGLTPMQLQAVMSEKLKQYMPAPEVSVVVQEVHSYAVSVLGEVKKPGRYELKGLTTVLDVLAEAGGFTDFASPSSIVILRNQGNAQTRVPFDYKAAVSKQASQAILAVKSGDIIVVP